MCIVAPQFFREDDYDLNVLWEVTKSLESKLLAVSHIPNLGVLYIITKIGPRYISFPSAFSAFSWIWSMRLMNMRN